MARRRFIIKDGEFNIVEIDGKFLIESREHYLCKVKRVNKRRLPYPRCFPKIKLEWYGWLSAEKIAIRFKSHKEASHYLNKHFLNKWRFSNSVGEFYIEYTTHRLTVQEQPDGGAIARVISKIDGGFWSSSSHTSFANAKRSCLMRYKANKHLRGLTNRDGSKPDDK